MLADNQPPWAAPVGGELPAPARGRPPGREAGEHSRR